MGTGQDYTYLGNLRFKEGHYEEAENYFDKASENFADVKSYVNLAQLYLTLARMETIVSRQEATDKYLGKAREVAKELGDPEYLMKSIQEVEKLKDSIDKK